MITINNLPEGFNPYRQLVVCSNTILGGGHLLVIGEVVPLVIGAGLTPNIWLQAVANPNESSFVTLIEASVSKHPAAMVSGGLNKISVAVAGSPVMSLTQISQESAIVEFLDLRPVGFNVYGDADSMNAGGAVFSGNTFIGNGALLAFGGKL